MSDVVATSSVVDWAPLLNLVWTVVGIVVTALAGVFGTWIAVIVRNKLHINYSDAQQAEMKTAAESALTFGLTTGETKVTNLIAQKGWDHIDVKSSALASAGNYLVTQFPDIVKRAGFDTSTPEAVAATAEALQSTLLTRLFPSVVATVAASPATPPVRAVPAAAAPGASSVAAS